MTENQDWSGQFEAERPRLRSIARGILGNGTDAEDAVQDAWLRLAAQAPGTIASLPAWLTTTVTRLCLDQLRRRSVRAEDEPLPLEQAGAGDLEQELQLAQSVGLAMQVVMEALDPAERVAFILHDVFALPFADIAPMLGRSIQAVRQLASRARRRVNGRSPPSLSSVSRQLDVAEKYLQATRNGDLEGIVALLDPDVSLQVDTAGLTTPVSGARNVASRAMWFRLRAHAARLALADGKLALVHYDAGRLDGVLLFGFDGERIATLEILTSADRLGQVRVAHGGQT